MYFQLSLITRKLKALTHSKINTKDYYIKITNKIPLMYLNLTTLEIPTDYVNSN